MLRTRAHFMTIRNVRNPRLAGWLGCQGSNSQMIILELAFDCSAEFRAILEHLGTRDMFDGIENYVEVGQQPAVPIDRTQQGARFAGPMRYSTVTNTGRRSCLISNAVD